MEEEKLQLLECQDRLREVLEQISEATGFFSKHKGTRNAFEELAKTKDVLQQLEKKMRDDWKIQPRHEPSWEVLL